MMQNTDDPQELLVYRIHIILAKLGVPANLIGHRYLVRAIMMVYHDRTLIDNVVNGLYSRLAAEYGTSTSCVERAARTALSHVDIKTLDRLMNRSCANANGRITFKTFAALGAQLLIIDGGEERFRQR